MSVPLLSTLAAANTDSCVQLGLGIMFGPVLSCVGSYFLRRRAVMIGICASGGALGAIVYPILLNNLFVSLGFAAAVRAGKHRRVRNEFMS